VGRPDGKRPLKKSRHRWENNIKMDVWENHIKMDVQEVGWGEMDWIELAQDRNRW
jgi:hypothetical protein